MKQQQQRIEMSKKQNHRAVIETIINSVALALTAYGVNTIINNNYSGYFAISFGVGLEFFKYLGRQKELW